MALEFDALRAALIEAGASPEKASRAVEEVATHLLGAQARKRRRRLDRESTGPQWMALGAGLLVAGAGALGGVLALIKYLR